MANNRMFLVNDRIGARVMLARYFPSSGWETIMVGQDVTHLLFGREPEPGSARGRSVNELLDGAFQSDPQNRAGMFGPMDWRLEYEVSEDEATTLDPPGRRSQLQRPRAGGAS